MVGAVGAPASVEEQGVVCGHFAPERSVLPPDFCGGCRPAGEYNGYTYIHLPVLPKKVDAIPASFAARMAFSSF